MTNLDALYIIKKALGTAATDKRRKTYYAFKKLENYFTEDADEEAVLANIEKIIEEVTGEEF